MIPFPFSFGHGDDAYDDDAYVCHKSKITTRRRKKERTMRRSGSKFFCDRRVVLPRQLMLLLLLLLLLLNLPLNPSSPKNKKVAGLLEFASAYPLSSVLQQEVTGSADINSNNIDHNSESSQSSSFSYGNSLCFISTYNHTYSNNSNSNSSSSSNTSTRSNIPVPVLQDIVPGCWQNHSNVDIDLAESKESTSSALTYQEVDGVFGKTWVLHAGRSHTFLLSAHVDVHDSSLMQYYHINNNNNVSSNSSMDDDAFHIVGAVRLIFCNALVLGGCDFLHYPSTSSPSTSNQTQTTSEDASWHEVTALFATRNASTNSVQFPANAITNNKKVNWTHSDLTLIPGDGGTGGEMNANYASSPWIGWGLKSNPFSNASFNSNSDLLFFVQHAMTVTFPSNVTSGAIYIYVHARFDFTPVHNSSNNTPILMNSSSAPTTPLHRNTTTRLDMIHPMSVQAAVVATEPYIQTVSDAMIIFTLVVCAVFSAFAFFCLVMILYHRKHPVMTLSQGNFLAALVLACLVQTAFSFVGLPTRDVFCILAGPMEILPMTIGASILVARVWRAYSTLGVANFIGRNRDKEIKKNYNDDDDEEETEANSSLGGHRRSKIRRCILNSADCEIIGEKYIQCLTWLAHLPLNCFRKQKDRTSNPVPMRQTMRKKVTATETASLAIVISAPQVVLQIFGAVYYTRELELVLDPTNLIGRFACEDYGSWVYVFGVCYVGFVYLGAVAASWTARHLPSIFNEKSQIFHAAFMNGLIAFVTLPLLELTSDPTDNPNFTPFLYLIFSIWTATSLLIIIVLPKLRRIWSGETVCLSTVLDDRFKYDAPVNGAAFVPSPSPVGGITTTTTTITAIEEAESESTRHMIREGDPLPHELERRILQLHDVLRSVEDKCCQGRPLSKKEWKLLREFTYALNAQLQSVDIVYSRTEDNSASQEDYRRSSTQSSIQQLPHKETVRQSTENKQQQQQPEESIHSQLTKESIQSGVSVHWQQSEAIVQQTEESTDDIRQAEESIQQTEEIVQPTEETVKQSEETF